MAETHYTVEVEAWNESQAESLAIHPVAMAGNVSDFDVDPHYCTYLCEAEQLSWECQECGADIATHAEYQACDEMCTRCHAKMLEEDHVARMTEPGRLLRHIWGYLFSRGHALQGPEYRILAAALGRVERGT